MENKKIDIAKVEAQIAKYQAIINKDTSKYQAYDLKARELMKINRLEEALECYNEVLKLQSENKIYLAQRAKLYGLTGQADKAFEDLKLISRLQQDSQEDDFSNLILSDTLKEVQKLDSINKKIAELRADKNINPGLLDAIENLSSVTGTLTVKVGVHEERLAGHDDAIKELQIQQQQAMKLMEKIQNSNAKDLANMQAEIQNQRLNALFAETKYRALELRVKSLEDFKQNFPDSFLKFGAKEKEFKNFLQKFDPKVQSALTDYMEGFISQCSVAYTSALVVKSGQFKLEDNSYVALGSKLISFIPYIGEVASSAIDFLSEQIETTKIETRTDNILKYCSSAYSFEQHMQYVVMSRLMDEHKKDIIVNSAEEEAQIWYEKIQALYEKIELAIKDKIQENIALKSSTAQYKLGLKDASDLLDIFILSGKVLKLSDKGLNEMISDLTPQDIKFVALDFQIDKPYKKNCYESIKDKLKAKFKAKCVVFTVNDIIYDNPLLNHPELLKLTAKEFGMAKALDIASSLSHDLILAAIDYGSAELVLAGCISLNQADAD